ncbi:MAG TPA: S8 family serine peptidase [Flavobacteriales bacterium]|nr:S8 family serine peptidase [Flavobacteriales bacterium]HNK68713.1 S8 family serine peptidase [Flavobacteriales bacterium]
MRKLLILPVLCLSAVLLAQQPKINGPGADHVVGDLLIGLQKGSDVQAVMRDLLRAPDAPPGLVVDRVVSLPANIWLLKHDPDFPGARALEMVRRHPAVVAAQFNHLVHERITPNDSQFSQQWHHVDPQDNDIDSDLAWNITTGGNTALGDTIVVCVVEGFDRSHSDLNANAWVNRAEIDGNGIDDDANGYVDDVFGWNPSAGNDNSLFSGSHGTSCAGMVGAKGNNANGVSGANWAVKMMPVRIGSLTEANVIASYSYALAQRQRWNDTNGLEGAFVVATSSSWGIDQADPDNYPLWCGFYDTLGEAGILNCGATTNSNLNVDVVGDMPTACSSPYMISVTATNSSDQRTFSGYGATTIDVGAPGESVRTTSSSNGYTTTSGTSFATPLTAGVIALLYSAPCSGLAQLAHTDPQGAADAVRTALFAGVDQVGNLPGQTVTGGRINANNSLQYILTNCATYSPGVSVSARVFLQGPYNSTDGLMADGLRTAGLIPNTEPFTALGFTHVNGGGGETLGAGVTSTSGADAVVDWVLLELRDAGSPAQVLATRSALVQRDGDITATDGVSPVVFGVGAGDYHVAVRHRNHLGAMTATAITLDEAPTPIDFTSVATGTFGTDARIAIGAVRALWTGNATGDATVKYTGGSNDRDPILLAVGSTTPNGSAAGYLRTDTNLDGIVKYTGSANDRDIILTNTGSTTPNAVRAEQLP